MCNVVFLTHICVLADFGFGMRGRLLDGYKPKDWVLLCGG